MKKVLLIIFVMNISLLLQAQIHFGVNAAANSSTVKIQNDLYKCHARVGVALGVFTRYDLNASLALQGEIDYSAEGGKWTRASTKGVIKESLLRIPVLLQYKTAKGLFLEAGPAYNMMLSFKESVDGDPATDEKDNMESGVFGYGIGAGYAFSGPLSGLRANIRFNGDLSPINKVEGGSTKATNHLIRFAFYYDLGKSGGSKK